MTKPFLMGAETEFAVSGLRDGVALDLDNVYDLLVDQVKKMRGYVPDLHGNRGLFLENGARIYLDYGEHPEHATAECFTPRQVAVYDRAGEFLLTLAVRAAEAESPGLRLRLVKSNVDPLLASGVTYGSHESYTSWAPTDQVAAALMAHLVSRVLYCGSGGLSDHPEGVGYELSQRAKYLLTPEGEDTTSYRAIFSTRSRYERDGEGEWTRIHLIGKDSQKAPFGCYLTFAVTGLLIEMLNRGMVVGSGLTLADPVKALHEFSRDPWGKIKVDLADGRKLSALEIQSIYLEECEKALQSGGLPVWANEAVGHWRETLTDFARDPRRLADRLDPYCKLVIYEHELRRSGLDWADLRGALTTLGALRSEYGDIVVRAVMQESDNGLTEELQNLAAKARETAGVGKTGVIDRLRFATRLQALELNYHESGGLFDRLRESGRMRDVICNQADIEQATWTPPLGGRAAIRGGCIRDVCARQEDGWLADWQYLWQYPTGRCLDIRDPFTDTAREVKIQACASRDEAECYDVIDLILAPPEPAPETVPVSPTIEGVVSAPPVEA